MTGGGVLGGVGGHLELARGEGTGVDLLRRQFHLRARRVGVHQSSQDLLGEGDTGRHLIGLVSDGFSNRQVPHLIGFASGWFGIL